MHQALYMCLSIWTNIYICVYIYINIHKLLSKLNTAQSDGLALILIPMAGFPCGLPQRASPNVVCCSYVGKPTSSVSRARF